MASNPEWLVINVIPQEDYSLIITFADGQKRCYDAKPLLQKGIYAPLKQKALFMSAKVECGTVVWNDEIDIAPEHLHATSIPCTPASLFSK